MLSHERYTLFYIQKRQFLQIKGCVYSLLFFAVLYENEHAVKYLLERGADVEWRNNTGTHVLRMVAKRGLINIGNMIVESVGHPRRIQKLVNAPNNKGWTCLHSAVENNRTDMVYWLMARDGIIDFMLNRPILLESAPIYVK